MKLVTALLITGVLLIFLDKKLTCPPNKVEYRYLPRDVNQYINDANLSTQNVIQTMKNQDGISWIDFKQGKMVTGLNKQRYNQDSGRYNI